MNIKKAKEQIFNTIRAYLAKDENGRFLIPPNKQRPLFLIGPPGIGKTEIMSQIASELNIGLLSYSITHHTRQSALGLPIIKQKNYGGEICDTSEYTMSEIISAVYDMNERLGTKNGILFLDEINCVSETMTPIMLQFLQYKVFGGHKLPDGWVVVTAGNPPEYNSSVREFDIVTWDRLKRIDVEPDLAVWKEFAEKIGTHRAVITYLDIKPKNFYSIRSEADGKSFVTARGWDDLGRILTVYGSLNIQADLELISQYIQDKKIAEDFSLYYELYCKYKSDYKISAILDGSFDEALLSRAKEAGFDERYTLVGLLLEAVSNDARKMLDTNDRLEDIKNILLKVKTGCENGADCFDALSAQINDLEQQRQKLISANNLFEDKDDIISTKITMLKKYQASAKQGFETLKSAFEKNASAFAAKLKDTDRHFANMFDFCEKAFGSAQEMLIIVTELAADPIAARYITMFGCDEYYRHDKELMFFERRNSLISRIDSIGGDIL